MKQRLKNYFRPFINIRFLICFLPPWIITNGIWYLGLYMGIVFQIIWLRNICGAYVAWLYTPLAAEKIVILPIAIWLCKKLFKNDQKTMNQLNNMLDQAKQDCKKIGQFFKKIFRRKK